MPWLVATTMPQGEWRASADLEASGIETYFPKLAAFEAARGHIVERVRPLFPGYLFCAAVAAWRAVADVRHVASVIMSGDAPAELRDDVVVELREREDAGGVIRLEVKPKRRFRKGMQVRISNGAMSGLSGIVSGMSGEERVQVLMDMLGRKTPVTLREAELIAA